MRALTSATTICRVLVRLDRIEASGALRLRGCGREGVLLLKHGRVVGANVDRRVATEPEHVVEGLYRMCGWEGLSLELERGRAGASWWGLDRSMRARDLALRMMRREVAIMGAASVRAELKDGSYRLTAVGEHLLEGMALPSEEQALVPWLARGVRGDDVTALPDCGPAAYRFLCSLKLLRAVAPQANGAYPLLLRKRRQVRHHASPQALLDLADGDSKGDARRALRKLVRDLHPDRFSGSVPPALQRASEEIVTALVDAEATLTSRRRR